MDFTSSGLENPLSYLFIAIFYAVLLRDETLDTDIEKKRLLFLYFIASLAFLNRQDTILLYAIPLLFLTFKVFLSVKYRVLKFVLIGILPAILWELFSLIYYGFPFPNTYYAKLDLGLPATLLLKQGLLYVINSLLLDPITISVILTAVCLPFFSKRKIILLSSISVFLYLTYTIKIGGDYMSGRFFSLPFLLSVILLDALLKKKSRIFFLTALLFLVVYNALLPHVPIKIDARLPWDHGLRAWGNITDEGGAHRRSTNLLFFSPFGDLSVSDFPLMPLKNWADDGKHIRENPANIILRYSGIGVYGFFAGPQKHIIDSWAIADPLLSRLPVSPKALVNFRHGHVVRDIPFGYGESLVHDTNLIADPNLREYYDKIRIITQSEIFSLRRLKYIAEINLKGKYDKPVEFAFTPKKNFVIIFLNEPSEGLR
jgi:arabinofuranosyltransferase